MLSEAKHIPFCCVEKQCYEILRFAQNDTAALRMTAT